MGLGINKQYWQSHTIIDPFHFCCPRRHLKPRMGRRIGKRDDELIARLRGRCLR